MTSSNPSFPTQERDARVVAGHEAWTERATPLSGVAFGREDRKLSVEEFRSLLTRCDIRRPVDDPDRLAMMLEHANLVITARDNAAKLIGVARSLTDFSYCCYLSDLAVDDAWQSQGIGQRLIAETKRLVGPQCMVLLVSAPKPVGFYRHIGMEPITTGFMIRRDS